MCSATQNMNSQRPTPQKKKLNLTDIVLFLAALFLLFNTPWGNTNSFHHLMFFLYVLCVMLRLSNIRKQGKRQLEQAKKQAEAQQNTQSEQTTSTDVALLESDTSVSVDATQNQAEETDSPKEMQ